MTALDYARELVRFESPSRVSNAAVADCVEDLLRRLEFSTERIEYDDARGLRKVNIVGKKGTGTGGMAYFGHTDVVPADTWSIAEHGPFQPTVKDGRLYGRGSCDMKGSVACMLAAAEQFTSHQLKLPLYITCTADEEIGYGGARQVSERSELYREMVAHASHGIIGEPTSLEVVHAHKGTFGFSAISRGRAAHSSTSKGLNANLAMIPFLVRMKAIHDELLTSPDWHDDRFDPPIVSWNIGINDHTTAVNITPPQSVCTVYFRTMPGQDAESLLERAHQAAVECGLEFQTAHKGHPLFVDPQSTFVQDVLQIAGRRESKTVAYGTDAAALTQMQNLLVFGPGDIAQAHTDDEWIALEQLDEGTRLYAKLIDHWCC